MKPKIQGSFKTKAEMRLHPNREFIANRETGYWHGSDKAAATRTIDRMSSTDSSKEGFRYAKGSEVLADQRKAGLATSQAKGEMYRSGAENFVKRGGAIGITSGAMSGTLKAINAGVHGNEEAVVNGIIDVAVGVLTLAAIWAFLPDPVSKTAATIGTVAAMAGTGAKMAVGS